MPELSVLHVQAYDRMTNTTDQAPFSLFGFKSGAALTTVVGVLIEGGGPVMLSVVKILNNGNAGYECGGAVQRTGLTASVAAGRVR